MKTIKVAEATGPALDWLVCEAAGLFAAYRQFRGGKAFLKVWGVAKNSHLHPSTNWAQGGPIIDREKIDFRWLAKQQEWCCYMHQHAIDGFVKAVGFGPTPLIAAMRCFVASKPGKTVEVPEELV